MEVTLRVTASNPARRLGRITVRADERSLTPYAGLAVSGELARRLGLAELIDAELAVERRARPVKVRRRGLSPGELVVSLAECQLVGGSFFDHIEDVRADRAGAGLRAVAGTPSAPAALQNAKRFRRCHVQRIERTRFTVSVPRNQAMWKTLQQIPDDAWTDALDMPGAQVAETTYTPAGWRHEPLRLIVRRVPFSAQKIADGSLTARRRKTIHPDQLALALDGQVASVFGYSFILTDIPHQPTVWIEHFHRHRAQIEERLKDTKLGQALRHLPSGDVNANRVWLTAALLALNLTAFCCDLCPAAGASGKAPDDAPLRRTAQTLRRILFNIPARIIRTARRTILRLPEGFRHADA